MKLFDKQEIKQTHRQDPLTHATIKTLNTTSYVVREDWPDWVELLQFR
jgi:hypothetical protein